MRLKLRQGHGLNKEGNTVNIEQLLEQLIKIFPIDNDDLELLEVLGRIQSILSDRTIELLNDRIIAIKKYLASFSENTLLHKTLSILNIIKLILSTPPTILPEQNAALIAEQKTALDDLLESTNKSVGYPGVIAYKIKKILTDITLNIEQKRNKLEAYIIDALMTEEDPHKKEIFQLALKISLLDRGYYIDDLGQLEKTLLMLPCNNSTCNPDTKNAKYSSGAVVLWRFINSVRAEISHCFDKPIPYCVKIEELAKLIRGLAEKYKKLDTEPDATSNDREIAESYRNFKLGYLTTSLKFIKFLSAQKHDQEWSLWASSSLETIGYLTYMNSKEFWQNTGGGTDKQQAVHRQESNIHRSRATHFIAHSKHLQEPVGHYAEYRLSQISLAYSSPRSKKNYNPLENMESVFNQTTSPTKVEIECFSAAQTILLNYKTQPENLTQALDLATTLEDDGNSLGTFIRLSAYILMQPLSKNLWAKYFDELQCIAIPKRWRFKISELWLCLADHLVQSHTLDRLFFKDWAIDCTHQIGDRYSERSILMAKLKRAQILNTEADILTLSEEINQLKENISDKAPTVSDPFCYAKQDQYILCKGRTQPKITSNEEVVPGSREESISAFLVNRNPYLIEEVLPLLDPNSPEHPYAVAAITNLFGPKYTNPLLLCELVLDKKIFNRYLMIWGPLYCDALNNGFLSTVDEWKGEGYSTNNINYKLFNTVRSRFYHAMYENMLYGEGVVIPGGCNFLIELDRKIEEVTLRLIQSHKHDIDANPFPFALKREGLTEALYALLFYYDGNLYVAEQLAKLSINFATFPVNAAVTPKKVSPSVSSSQVSTPDHGSPESSKKTSPRDTSPRALRSLSFATTPQDSPEIPLRAKRTAINHLSTQQASSAPSLSPAGSLKKKPSSGDSPPPIAASTGNIPTAIKRGPSLHILMSPLDLSKVTPSQSPPARVALVRPESTAISPAQSRLSEGNEPTSLGHLIKAQVIWDQCLKNNKERRQEDIDLFKRELNDAKKAANLEEQDFIKGMMWWGYFNSRPDYKSDYDRIWLSDDDYRLYESTLEKLSVDRLKYLSKTNGNKSDYVILKIVKSYWLDSSKGKSGIKKSVMFPPAVLALFTHLKYYMEDFACGDAKRLEEDKRELAGLLREAVLVHVYDPALYAYAENYSFAHNSTLQEDDDLLNTGETKSDRLKLMKKAYAATERTTHLDEGKKETVMKQIAQIEAEEALLCERRLAYTLENPQPLNVIFTNMPFQMKYHQTKLSFECVTAVDDQQEFCFLITCTGDNELEIEKDLRSVEDRFKRAEMVYTCCKKVSFSKERPILVCDDDQLIIKHADVAILGMIMIVEAKDSPIKWRDSQIASLMDFLREANTLPPSTWQWERTYERLQSFVQRNDHEQIRKEVKKIGLSPPVERLLAPSRSNSRIGSNRTSVMLPSSPRRIQYQDNSPLPSSPRGVQIFPPRRDSSNMTKIEDETLTADSAAAPRNRSQTFNGASNTPFRKK
jgi:hypothetical protein